MTQQLLPHQGPQPFVQPHQSLWDTGPSQCSHRDMTPIFGQEDVFRCDECSCKPESGWLFTCTQAVVRADGSIDPLKSCFLDPVAYSAIKQGKYTENEIKIMIKQRLAFFSAAHGCVPQFAGSEYSAHRGFRQSAEVVVVEDDEEEEKSPSPSPSPSMSSESKKRQMYLKEKGLRVRFSEEISYRSPSPTRTFFEHDGVEKTIEVQENGSDEHDVSAEEDVAEFVAYTNAIKNMCGQSSIGSFNWFRVQTTGYGLVPYSSFSLDGAQDDDLGWAQKLNLQKQNKNKSPHYYTVQEPAQSLDQNTARDDAHLERLGHTFDYHKAMREMHQISQHRRGQPQPQPQLQKQQPQPEPIRPKPSLRSPFNFFKRDNHNKALADLPGPVRPPVQSPNPASAFGPVPRRTQTGNQGPAQVSYPSRGVVQVPPELLRGRSRHREQPQPQPQPRSHQRTPFVLHIGNPEDMNQYRRVPVTLPARSLGVIDKAHLPPEYRNPPAGGLVPYQPGHAAAPAPAMLAGGPAAPAGMVTRAATQKALPPTPHSASPVLPAPSRPIHTCNYKLCEACLEGHPDSETLLPATRYNPQANPNRASPSRSFTRPGIPRASNPVDPHAQPFFFRPDSGSLDPVPLPGQGQHLMMRDAQYFVNRDRDLALRDMVANRTIAATGQNPFAENSGVPLTSPMERRRPDSRDPWAEQNLGPQEEQMIAEVIRHRI